MAGQQRHKGLLMLSRASLRVANESNGDLSKWLFMSSNFWFFGLYTLLSGLLTFIDQASKVDRRLFMVRYATEHRCGLVVKRPTLSGNISGTDPLNDNHLLLKAKALDDSHEARNTIVVVNELSKEIAKILVSYPVNAKCAAEGKNIANVVLLRGCDVRIKILMIFVISYVHESNALLRP
ncbi:2,3-bisphosphoglycerate-independent phosphoglycerate mutase [Spatholobus suberectus]|nr:2,3-bisphosphoglycerate-independent phosphoglycerate mutase [Spatholobus suberectus]